VTAWLKGLPTAKRPLVKTGVQLASDRAIEVLLVRAGGGGGARLHLHVLC